MSKSTMCARGLALALVMTGAVGCDASLDLTDADATARADAIQHYAAVEGEGLWIKALNRDTTACLDGAAEACPIDVIDFTGSGLDPDQVERADVAIRTGDAIAVGWMDRVESDDGVPADTLHVVHVWLAEVSGSGQAVMYTVSPLDIVCVRAPCPAYEAATVNRKATTYLHYVDLEASGASGAALDRGYTALDRGELLVGGEVTELSVPGTINPDEGRMLVVEAFYTPMR